jgi:hypothetical protein
LEQQLSEHYRWDPKRQTWAAEGAEIAIVVGVVALFVGLIALALVLR